MRQVVNTAIAAGGVILLVLVTALGWRVATRTVEPSDLPNSAPTSPTSPSSSQRPSAAPPSSPTSSGLSDEGTVPDSPAPERVPAADARVRKIPDRQWRLMVSTGTGRPECPVGRSDLRRIELNYRTFGGGVQRGQLVAHRDSVDDLVEVFTALFDAGFPIERMEPVERFGGDVNRSLEANNTSAFNCRKPDQINAPVTDSPHANGRAIDINPVQNPWRDPRCTCWRPGPESARAKGGPGVIRLGSLPERLFGARDWIWQNIDVPDYMHFDTGYPSRPRKDAPAPVQDLPTAASQDG